MLSEIERGQWRAVAMYYRELCVSYRRAMHWQNPEIDMLAPRWPDGIRPDGERFTDERSRPDDGS